MPFVPFINSSPSDWYDRCRVLTYFSYDPEAVVLQNLLQLEGIRTDRVKGYLGREGEVSIGMFQTGYTLVVLCLGALDELSARNLWDSYLGRYPYSDQRRCLNKWADEIALNFLGKPEVIDYLAVSSNVDLVGHSAGGVVCDYIAVRLAGMTNPPNVIMTTFGQPKSSSQSLFGPDLSNTKKRVMCDNDPVPWVPPSLTLWQRVTANISRDEASRLTGFAHSGAGAVITQDGRVRYQPLPDTQPDGEVSAVGRWLWEADRGRVTGHSLATYETRLRDMAGRQVNMGRADHREGLQPRVEQTPVQQVERIQERLVSQIATASGRQDRGVAVIPTRSRFRAKRKMRIWNVLFNDTIVMSGVSRRTAQAIARAGNYFLRRTLSAHYVDPQTFLDEFQSWLGQAMDPTSGIEPTLNTDPFAV